MEVKKIWQWIEYNRFIVIGPVLAVIIWFTAISCAPEVVSPINESKIVDASGLELEYMTWQNQVELTTAKFEAAGKDLEKQKTDQEKLLQIITTLASGSVATWPGLLQLLIGGGGLGAITDNIRKRGVIAGLKKNI